MKKLKSSRFWRGLTIVTVILAVFSVTLTGIAQTYSSMVNKVLNVNTSKKVSDETGGNTDTQYYKSAYQDLEEMYQAKVDLMRRIAQEGTILLKNENHALPVSSGKITVLGAENLVYATGNGGGSMTAETLAASTGLEDALEYDGLTVNTSLDEATGSDAVLVVIGRVAGEGADLETGALALTEEELELIHQAEQISEKVIVLSSGDYYTEMKELENDPKIAAILHIGNAGYRGTYGVADVITGIVSPSGKTVETIAADSTSSPAMMNFGNYKYTNSGTIMASQAKNYVVYAEGIYTDYKYYETRYEDCVLGQGNAASTVGTYEGEENWNYADEVVYGYGYGLSYTEFEQEIMGEPVFDEENHTATITVKVTNVGDTAAKDVVQVYAQTPYTEYDVANNVEKASVQLVNFDKTEELKPGESQTLDITVNMQWLASYDYTNAKTYIMDAGDYYFALGNGAHDALNNILAAKGKTSADGMTSDGNAALTYKWTQDELDTATWSHSVYTGEEITNHFEDADINYWLDDGNKITYLSRSAWDTTYPETLELEASQKMMASLNDTKKYNNGEWNDTASRAEASDVTYAEDGAGENSLSVVAMKDKAYDDEGWDAILDSMTISEMSNLVANGRYYINECPSISFPASTGSDSPTGLDTPYAYSKVDQTTGEKTPIGDSYLVTDGITEEETDIAKITASMFASEPVLAATYNKDLAYEQGEMFGEDGIYHDYSFTWGPGADMHRTPYGGRAAEYYSADAVHTTMMGSSQVQGARTKGHVLVVKHFVVNEQEQNRIGIATFVNEQALRENYLRSFEGIATYGQMQGMMSSYNRLGLIGTSSEYDLMTSVLREEWGNEAYVITDLNSPTAGLYDGDATIAAGASMIMNNGEFAAATGSFVNTCLSVENIKNDPILLTAVREACHRILYTFVNSIAVNGISSGDTIVNVTPWWQYALVGENVVLCLLAAVSVIMYLIRANAKRREE